MTFISLLAPNTFNIKQYGATGDGITDDTSAIASAITAATSGGGIVYGPPGTYITTTQTLPSNVIIAGAGKGVTVFKLKNATNADLFSANTGNINLSGSSATGSSTAISNWGLRDLTLDGNKANQSGTSYCLRVYGYAFTINNVRMQNGLSGDWQNDWNGPADSTSQQTESQVVNLESYNAGSMCLEFGGPHNTQFVNCFFGYAGNHCVHVGPNATACQWTNCHALSPKLAQSGGAVAWLIEAPRNAFVNCDAKDSDTVQVVILADHVRWNGRIWANGQSAAGVQIGQGAGNTPYSGMTNQSSSLTTAVTPTMCVIDSLITDCIGTNGAVWLANDGGKNQVRGVINQASGSYLTGTISTTTELFVQGTGLTADGTLAKAATTTLLGQLALTQSATAPDPGASGTVNTTNVGIARVNPSGASRASCVLQAGTQPGQFVTVVNENSSNTLSWATEATSNIAGESGATFVLSAKGAQSFWWDSSTSRWYPILHALVQSGSAVSLASSGTISTASLDISRVTTSGAVTSVVMQAGTYSGQRVIVSNESANLITFAASGTSNVSAGTGATVTANTSKMFIWTGSLWY